MKWGVAYYQQDNGSVPAADFLAVCPIRVRANLLAVVEAVRAAPPPAFSGGGKWDAMHGSMAGYYEIRGVGPGRRHYRLFCILENGTGDELAARGFAEPQIVILNGLSKPNASLFTDSEYRKHIRALGDHYRASMPRPVVS